ncbi:hypothetical protein RMN57_35620 [Kitasatospora sp. CM 4170]|uniref:ABC transporter permease n=1 Tax=Kitasatospora aburaviensis TaxID=67265 RepID=A0ABW1F150_9ACTN|nr:hypothetical protein [Kitasatospora sp. CM 4170]WNM49652.1 hypothetical protein RMN57_35620 [Kitasatospora sp. CM 4170]
MSAVAAASSAARRAGVLQASWLRHRSALLTLLGVLAGAAVLLAATGLYIHAGFEDSGAARCDPGAEACARVWKAFLHEYGTPIRVGEALLPFLGGALGAFTGGPLVAREFEHGTFRFAWTQGAGRARWTAAGLALAGAVLGVGSALLGLLLAWWSEPAARQWGRFSPAVFAQSAPSLVGRALFAFGVAALAGAVLRRTVVSVGVGLVVSVAGSFAGEALRFHYLPPLEGVVHSLLEPAADQRWVGSMWFADPAGRRLPDGDFYRLGQDFGGLERLVRDGGYSVHQVYQPGERYWPFQIAESGWMAAVGIAACAAAVWWVRRRAS